MNTHTDIKAYSRTNGIALGVIKKEIYPIIDAIDEEGIYSDSLKKNIPTWIFLSAFHGGAVNELTLRGLHISKFLQNLLSEDIHKLPINNRNKAKSLMRDIESNRASIAVNHWTLIKGCIAYMNGEDMPSNFKADVVTPIIQRLNSMDESYKEEEKRNKQVALILNDATEQIKKALVKIDSIGYVECSSTPQKQSDVIRGMQQIIDSYGNVL